MIWEIEQQLPWHVAFGLLELAMVVMLGDRFRRDKQVAILPAVGLGLAVIGHVIYAMYFAEKHPRIGPYPLPWHGLFGLLEGLVVAFLGYRFFRNRTISADEASWLVVVLAAHAFYTLRLADDNPTFPLEIRWYGVFFAIGLAGAARAYPIYFERWGFPRKHAEQLTLWTPIGMLLGAHFVHLIFYETETFLNDPIRIFQLGSGLASHGGGIGAVVAMGIFCYRVKVNPMKYVDASMCAATWVIPWVRVGNFFNSEIVGRPWDGPWAIAFPGHDCPGYPQYVNEAGNLVHVTCDPPIAHPTPAQLEEIVAEHHQMVLRHPSQIYEAVLAFIMVGLAVYLAAKWRNRLRPGAIFFMLLAYYFTTRFLIEFVKDGQTAFDDRFPLTMGQCLSIPIVLVSLYMLIFSKTSNIRTPYVPEPQPAEGPSIDDEPSEDARPAVRTKRASSTNDTTAAKSPSSSTKTKKKKRKRH